MVIKELDLIHFGKFHHYKIELGPHLNVLCGPNEAGKSTICAFIRCMLFGARRLRGRAAASDLYSRYLPWETPGSYEGAIIFEYSRRTYRLYRNFYKDGQSVSLICLDTGKPEALPHGHLGDLIPGLTEENYLNTIHVAQGHSAIDTQFALELQSQAANLAMTGSASLHLGQALDYLKEERLKLQKTAPTDQLKLLEEKIDTIKAQKAAWSRENETEGRQQGKDDPEALAGQLTRVRREMQQCQTRAGMLISEEKQWSQIVHDRQARADFWETRKAPPETDGGDDNDQSSHGHTNVSGTFARRWLVCLAAGAVLGVLFMLLWSFLPPWLAGAGSAVSLFLVILGILGGMGLFGRKGDMEQPEPKRQPSEAAAPEQRKAAMAQADQARQQLAQIKKEKEQLGQDLSLLEQKEAQLQEQLGILKKHQERREWEAERQAEADNALEEYEEQVKALKSEIKALDQELFCIDTARQTIQSLAQEIHEDFGGQLCREASRIMEEITGNARRFYVNPDLKVSVDNSRTLVPMDRLSKGTVEQMHVALRLSASELVFGSEEMPVILDDTFAFYDDGRLKAFLRWLSEKRAGQAILMTCQHRECDMLDGLNVDYNYVNLEA